MNNNHNHNHNKRTPCHNHNPSSSVCTRSTTKIIVTSRGGAFINGVRRNSVQDLYSRGRGGGFYDDGESYDDYDSYDSDVDVDVDAEVITSKNDPGGRYDRAAATAKPMSNYAMDETTLAQIGKSYFLTSIMWLSLGFDIVTNSRKRSLIFPTSATAIASSSAGLSSGFILSSAISYLLSVEFNRGAVKSQEVQMQQQQQQQQQKREKKNEKDEYVITMNERLRKKLHLYLCLFGILNLGANLNPSKAPFLGMSGFIINTHNALIAYNSWKKDALVEGQTVRKEFMDIGSLFYNSLFFWREHEGEGGIHSDSNNNDNSRGIDVGINSDGENEDKKTKVWILGTKSLQRCLSTSFSIASLIALIRGAMIIVSSLVPYYLAGSMKVASVEKMQFIGLQWAKVARAVLCGGLCLSLREEVQNGRNIQKWGYKNGLV
eukprot:CAMPEP_0203669986 /NCGR_PEP_ID=MMETSP0090-20130426/6201_1 /ASSEMBLY_ACC=CAM_ASM_001088 /TAXON_ID=426623 /ORGANISM="Chaetoceros affinis, Strain CCMP159" /LENGTH=432 /DNA_ID=CAMNT_0050534755 /DNA_START=308 /DNA_END=1603 /DNA_ORIENTATION=+